MNVELENIIAYLDVKELTFNKTFKYSGGLHGYTYLIDKEGKKKLQKGTPTTNGYYVGNNKKANTVVNINNYITLTITNGVSLVDSLLSLLVEFLRPINLEPQYKNICIITKEAFISKLVNYDMNKLKENNNTIGKLVLTPKNVEQLGEIQQIIRERNTKQNKVFFDVDSAVEGGEGNKLASKQSGLGTVETNPKGTQRIIFNIFTKKDYENPENDFNKIVSAGRWYFNTGDSSDYYDLNNGYRTYYFGRVEPDKKYYGKLTPDVTFSHLFTKTPITLLDKIFDYTKRLVPNPNEYLSAGILDTVISKDAARIVDTYPGIKSGKNIEIPFTSGGEDNPTLVELIDPPLLSFHIRNNIAKVNHLFSLFINKDNPDNKGYHTFIDITDRFFVDEENKKGIVKRKLHPDFKQNTSTIKVEVEHRNAIKPVPLIISVGYDLPDRNSLNSCCDEFAKVWLGVDTQNDKGVRYYCVVATDNWIYIQASAVANLRVLNIKELGIKIPKEEKK